MSSVHTPRGRGVGRGPRDMFLVCEISVDFIHRRVVGRRDARDPRINESTITHKRATHRHRHVTSNEDSGGGEAERALDGSKAERALR